MKVNYTTQPGSKRPNVIIEINGMGVNYGGLVVVTMAGSKPFVIDAFYLDRQEFKDAECTGIQVDEFQGEIHHPLTIRTEYGHGHMHCWAVNQDDVAEVASLMSEVFCERVVVTGQARNLGTWYDGEEIGQRQTLTDFYDEVTAEQLAETRF